MASRVEDRERRGFFSQLWTIALSLMGCLAAVVAMHFLIRILNEYHGPLMLELIVPS